MKGFKNIQNRLQSIIKKITGENTENVTDKQEDSTRNTQIYNTQVLNQQVYCCDDEAKTGALHEECPSDEVKGYLVRMDEQAKERIVYINTNSFIIGRLREFVHYILHSKAVGRKHAEIIYDSGMFYIRDLQSKNGTYVNDNKLIPDTFYALEHKDIIKFADIEHEFLDGQLVGSLEEICCNENK